LNNIVSSNPYAFFKDLTPASQEKYKKLLVKFILFMMSPFARKCFQDQVLIEAVDEYVQLWRCSPPAETLSQDDPIVLALQDLLMICVDSGTASDFEPRSKIPMYLFLMHKSIQGDGTYVSTDSITQSIAKLQYITRGVLLIQGHLNYEYVSFGLQAN
jgi:hypothetical protein